ncbi:helix-turn-helix transcriptional regulator [Demequina phytophila]|uniref:helix-turn-helix transcriptional regulator n=1 Tax=Demequina phytophila TaxID=1638981 RepID=UPI000785D571
MTPELLTVHELAELLRTTPSTIYAMRSSGRGPRSIRADRKRLLFRRSDVDSWLDEQSEPDPTA